MAAITVRKCTDTTIPDILQAHHPIRPVENHGDDFFPVTHIHRPLNKPTYCHPLRSSAPTRKLRGSSMPASTGSQSLLASLPSFMSVFGDNSEQSKLEEVDTNIDSRPASDIEVVKKVSSTAPNIVRRPDSALHHRLPSAFRRDSTSTYGSVDSSPTTTVSTVESSLTEPSPSSSPESPNSMLPHSPGKRANSTSVIQEDMDSRGAFASSFPQLPVQDRAASPNKKMRNMKNLSVNTSASNRQASQLSKVSLPNTGTIHSTQASSAPPTPAFIVPPKPKKKPSLLGLSIPSSESTAANVASQERPLVVPQTSSEQQIRSLRLLQTASSNGSLFSPTHAPEGGMRLPPMNTFPSSCRFGASSRPPLSISPRSSFDASVTSPISKQTLEHVQEEPDYELPLSQEAKSPAYPQGPVCIYDPHVYLYLEPTYAEAQEFDVILNVAREVRNPFAAAAEQALHNKVPRQVNAGPATSPGENLAGRDIISEPHTAVSERSFGAAVQEMSEDAIRSVPTTPKAIQPEPEYIHVPWDHNTNVVDDLLRLCRVIDDRVQHNKRILIHCQCGVSRSASLVVAYGLYKNPQLTVQEAYDAVKNRSRWIGPNMNLIYQLSEFKTKLAGLNKAGPHLWPPWRAFGVEHSSPDSLLSPDAASSTSRKTPQKSLSVPSPLHVPSGPLRTSSFSHPKSETLAPRSEGGEVTPGPSSAPPDMAWPLQNPLEKLETGSGRREDSQIPAGHLDEVFGNLSPKSTNDDPSYTLSPLSPGTGEAFSEKSLAPVGGVVRDLARVALDLDEKTSLTDRCPTTSTQTPKERKVLDNNSAPNPANSESDTLVRSLVAPRPTTPTLPGGFSSLLNRRQGIQSQRLPLRQEVPIPTKPMAFGSFNTILHDDVPPTPSVLSPRAAEFTASPFHRTAAGDLAGSSVFEQGMMSPRAVEEDPRSPHQLGEAPISRSIFEILGKPPV